MPQTATIKSLPAAFRMLKAMQAEDVEWGEDYRQATRQALAELLEGRMDQLIDAQLERMAELGQADRRKGYYARWLLTELGMIELHVPRTRTFSTLKVVRAYARRVKDVDRMILACFVLGLSTRKVAAALLPVLGRPVSPATVSAVARQLDCPVRAGLGPRSPTRPGNPWPRFIAGHFGTSTASWCSTGSCSSARPAPARWRVPCWSRSACARTAKRRSSTFIWRAPRAPRNGSSSSAI